MSKEENTDLKEIKEFLIGTEFDRKDCLSYRFDAMETKVCVMQNQLSTLMQRHEKEKNRITFGKVLKKIASLFISAKTGL